MLARRGAKPVSPTSPVTTSTVSKPVTSPASSKAQEPVAGQPAAEGV
jgi:hypothetical protein